jgi:hypothetical protein
MSDSSELSDESVYVVTVLPSLYRCTVRGNIRSVKEGVRDAGVEAAGDDPGVSCCTGSVRGSGDGSKLLWYEAVDGDREGEVGGATEATGRDWRRSVANWSAWILSSCKPCWRAA